MLPPHERLHALDVAVDQPDERLERQPHLAPVDAPAQPGEQREAGRLARVALRVEHHAPRTPVRFRPRQRDRAARMSSSGRPTAVDASATPMLAVTASECPPTRNGVASADRRPVRRPGDRLVRARDEHSELVTADARHEVLAGGQLQPAGDREQQLVADLVAEAVVDRR